MDLGLLSKMVKELILDNDEVTLPGVGSFVTEIVPASFSDRGYTINPPYRRLSFRQKQSTDNSALISFYAASNQVDIASATRIVTEFLEQMQRDLKQKKTLVFPGLGRLRATRENNFFFIADEDLDIYPAGFALEPISLKTHQETPEEVSSALENLRALVDEKPAPQMPAAPTLGDISDVSESDDAGHTAVAFAQEDIDIPVVSESAASEEPEAPAAVQEQNQPDNTMTEMEPKKKESRAERRRKRHYLSHREKPSLKKILFWTLLALISLAIIGLLVFMILAQLQPEFIDRLLYTSEELEIINTVL